MVELRRLHDELDRQLDQTLQVREPGRRIPRPGEHGLHDRNARPYAGRRGGGLAVEELQVLPGPLGLLPHRQCEDPRPHRARRMGRSGAHHAGLRALPSAQARGGNDPDRVVPADAAAAQGPEAPDGPVATEPGVLPEVVGKRKVGEHSVARPRLVHPA